MRNLILITALLIGLISNAQMTMCDSIMKQMDVEIESAKKNGADATMIKYLEQAKETLRNQYCKDHVFNNNGENDGSGSNSNSNSNETENNNPYVKTRLYAGTPFYGKQKISVSVKNNSSDGNANANYSYYINKEGSLILLDKQSFQGNLSLVPSFDGYDDGGGKFEYWGIRNDGLSTVFGLSDKNEKIAVTTYTNNFMFSPNNNSKPTIKKLNQTKNIAGYLCNAYQITAKDEKGSMTMTWWITAKPLLFNHDVVPFATMFMADKVGFPNLKNHGVLEIDGKHGTESVNLKVTKIEPATKSVQFNGYKEYYFEY